MITLKQLKWCNAFSYGTENSIDFTDSKLLQLVGANGNGKSSIALILEEILYNKNSKGIKKGDIINRHISDKYYTISLNFTKNNDEYYITTKRGSTQQVKLYMNGNDISSHTSTGTYKLIEEIIGIDHKTFCQIVCLSDSSSLSFLTSPDTARKKFLIELLNLSKYTKIGDTFKQLASELNKEFTTTEGKVATIKQWIEKYSNIDFTRKELEVVPELLESVVLSANELQITLSNIAKTNKQIVKNNAYIETKNSLQYPVIPSKPTDDIDAYVSAKAISESKIQAANSLIKKMRSLGQQCPTCLQCIDSKVVDSLIEEQTSIITNNTVLVKENSTLIDEYNSRLKCYNSAKAETEQWEKLHQLIDPTLPTEILDEVGLHAELAGLQKQIAIVKDKISSAQNKNLAIKSHNDKLDLIEAQITDMNQDLASGSSKLEELNSKLFRLNVLTKAFSTTGLVAYKIENLAKDLEDISNKYLSELSDGKYLISFQINGSDKLDVVITDNGSDIQMEALSKGETARVNVAVLLAIRKLMQSISDSRINLLFLDETISALDTDGRERLIEVLLAEENLNTVLVSHEFEHPLLEKLMIGKPNNISTIYKE